MSFNTSPSQRQSAFLSTNVLAGYAIAVAAVALLCAITYGVSLGAPDTSREVRDCAVLSNNAARLACYDGVAHQPSPLPGRGFAPIAQ